MRGTRLNCWSLMLGARVECPPVAKTTTTNATTAAARTNEDTYMEVCGSGPETSDPAVPATAAPKMTICTAICNPAAPPQTLLSPVALNAAPVPTTSNDFAVRPPIQVQHWTTAPATHMNCTPTTASQTARSSGDLPRFSPDEGIYDLSTHFPMLHSDTLS